MRALLLFALGCFASFPVLAALYKHVDDSGRVTYSDHPRHENQEPLRLPPPNVATPEARRQLEIARQASEREAQAEFEARMRRWAAAQRASPAAHPRGLSPTGPRFSSSTYLPYAYPSFNTFTAIPRPAVPPRRTIQSRR